MRKHKMASSSATIGSNPIGSTSPHCTLTGELNRTKDRNNKPQVDRRYVDEEYVKNQVSRR